MNFIVNGFHWMLFVMWLSGPFIQWLDLLGMLISTGLCCFAESLLLGSLLWFLGVMCLFSLPKPIHSYLESVPMVRVEEKAPGNPVRREAGSNNYVFTVVNSRRCKASRTKMKMTSHSLSVLA